MHFVFYGPEGSGKGTQAKLLAEKLGLPVYTTGDLVREQASLDKSPVGETCRRALSEGKYLPDEVVNQLISKKLNTKEAKKGFVLDGFPRTINQARFLSATIQRAGYKLDKFIYLKLSEEESFKRLAKRRRALFASSRILHDDPKRVKQRLSVYRKNEKEVLEFYRKRDLVLEVNAEQSVEKVFKDIIAGLHLK